MDARLQDVCTVCIEAFRLLTIDLKPAAGTGRQVETFLVVSPCVLQTPPRTRRRPPSATTSDAARGHQAA
jgi:hypothetical protein